MTGRLVLLAAILVALVVWERSLAEDRAAARASSSRLRPLIDEETERSLVVAGVRVETAQGETFLFGRSRGVWRLVEPKVGTYAQAGAVERLIGTLVDATGVVVTNEKRRAKSYGFGTDVALRLTLHGTQLMKAEDGDPLYVIDLGFPIQGTNGSYVRPLGTHEVWSIDQNPRALLTRPPGSSFPPMLDPHVIPAVDSSHYHGFTQIEFHPRFGESYAMRAVGKDTDELQPGEAGYTWELVTAGGATRPCDEIPSMGYSLFLPRATYSKILGASEADPELLERPDFRLVLTPRRGEPFELLFGAPERSGARLVANLGNDTLFEVDGDTAELLLPTAQEVSDESEGNPWHDYIQINPLEGANPLLNPILPR